jgi:membrane-associated protein
MNYKKYSLYNAIGALIWGAGLTYFGFLIGYIPPVAQFVEKYIDVILIGAVVVTLVPTLFHYFQSTRRAKKAAAAKAELPTDAEVALDPSVFEKKPSKR